MISIIPYHDVCIMYVCCMSCIMYVNVLDSRCSVLTSLEHLSGGPRNKFQVSLRTPDTNSKSNQIQI